MVVCLQIATQSDNNHMCLGILPKTTPSAPPEGVWTFATLGRGNDRRSSPLWIACQSAVSYQGNLCEVATPALTTAITP